MVLSWPHNILNLERANRPASRAKYGLIIFFALARRKNAMLTLAFLAVAGVPLLAFFAEHVGIPAEWTPVLTFIFGGGSFALLMKILLETRDELKRERAEAARRRDIDEAAWERRNKEWNEATRSQAEVQARFLQWLSDLDEGAFCPFRGEKADMQRELQDAPKQRRHHGD